MKVFSMEKIHLLMTHIHTMKFEIKMILGLIAINYLTIRTNIGYSGFIDMLWKITFWTLCFSFLILIFIDFIKSDKFEYSKNSYFVEYLEDAQKKRFKGLAKGMELIFNSIMIIGILVILSFVFCLLVGNSTPYIILSVLGGVYILGMVQLLRRKLLDERMNYIDEISESLEAMMKGNLNVNVPELEGHVFCQLAKNINKMRSGYGTALEDKIKSERMKSELITNVSHDLKTPLTSIINYVDLLKKEDLTPEHTKDYVLVLEKKTQRLHVLIQDLFEISSASSGNSKLEMQELDVVELLRQTLAEQNDAIMNSKLDFIVDLPDSPIVIWADGNKLHRVFDNLISNALKYSLTGTRVYVNFHLTDDFIQIVFKNISNYRMDFNSEEILQRFTRADSARSSEGSGLGLAIAQSFLHLMGMKIQIITDGDLFKSQIQIPTKKSLSA